MPKMTQKQQTQQKAEAHIKESFQAFLYEIGSFSRHYRLPLSVLSSFCLRAAEVSVAGSELVDLESNARAIYGDLLLTLISRSDIKELLAQSKVITPEPLV